MNDLEYIKKYLKNLKLLYAEDNLDVRGDMEVVLREFFRDIVLAKDGKEGLEKFKNNKIDIVITDILCQKWMVLR